MKLTVNRWGNSLGIRIPKVLAKNRKIQEGTLVEIEEVEAGLLIRTLDNQLSMSDILDSIPDDYSDDEMFSELLPTEQW